MFYKILIEEETGIVQACKHSMSRNLKIKYLQQQVVTVGSHITPFKNIGILAPD